MKLRNKYTNKLKGNFARVALLLSSGVLLTHTSLQAGGDFWITGQSADIVIGQPDFETENSDHGAADLYRPADIAIDPITGKVYVSDLVNNRVLRYNNYAEISTGESAEAVLGQPDFDETTAGLDRATMNEPYGLAIGPNGELWVSDYGNNRILRFDDAATIASGSDADAVLGQPDFLSGSNNLTQDGLFGPRGLFVDFDGNLIVADARNKRVVVYADAASKFDGANADVVLGQPDFTSNGSRFSQSIMASPAGIFLTDDRVLYVADASANRILIYDDVTGLSNGAPASRVLGQVDFDTASEDLSQSKFEYPTNIVVSETGKLFVCDRNNTRVLVFNDPDNASGITDADTAIGAPDFDSSQTLDPTSDISTSWGLEIDPENRLWVADFGNNRVLIFNEEYTKADLTIGDRRNNQKGNNVYNTTGAGQKKRVRTSGKKVKLHCRIGNDGTFTDSFTCSGSGTNRKFRVKHFAYAPSKTNVTAQVKVGTYTSSEVASASFMRYRMDVKPKKSSGRARLNAYVNASSITDGESDRVIGKVVYRE